MRAMLAGLSLAILGTAAAAAGDDPLARLRGTSRVLVVSAPGPEDADLRAQRAALGSVRRGLAERDLTVVEAVGTGAEAAALRKRLRLPEGAFRAVLIGKDGGAKLTATEPILPQSLFATIDAMPMRRDEMRDRRP
jgi:fructose-specific component phosphotransferase system IIB-like protein